MHSLDRSVSVTHAPTANFPSVVSDESACGGNGVTTVAYEDWSNPGRGAQRARSAARRYTRSLAAAQCRAAGADSRRRARPAQALAVVCLQPLSSSATRIVPGFFCLNLAIASGAMKSA
ncbi:unnamed protein product [Spodoptera exigua]|nr:unnamed protein product [Spodoptera exigua]